MGSCATIEQQAIDDYGKDYLQQLKSSPENMSAALSQIVSNNCKDHFDYDRIVRDFCGDVDNLLVGIGDGTKTCQSIDTSGVKTAEWCMLKENSSDKTVRMGTQKSVCNKAGLKGKYDDTAVEYCKAYPEDSWCMCYNVLDKTKVCSANSEAAGCNVLKNVEDNKEFFKDGYEILKDNLHCRPRVCNRPNLAYVPEGTMNSCQSSYNFCGKDIDIKNQSNSSIVLDCNMGMTETQLPEWWDEGGDDSWLTMKKRRKPPFNVWPLTLTPITEFPEEFDWEEDNVRYLTYGSFGSVVMCSCCMFALTMVMRMSKK